MTNQTQNAFPCPCPIVGIGASAGGVEALQHLFEALPDRLGVAFVVIIHLDPERRSELVPILARKTALPVEEVNGSVPLKADRVYVIAPDRRLQITNAEISAFPFDQPRGQRAPIDLFFRSLAEQYGDGFALILSGSGSDGAVGVKAVKEQGGLILVQDPNEATFDGMPRAAIATGMADLVLPLRDLASRLVQLIRSKHRIQVRLEAAECLDADDETTLGRIFGYLQVKTGHDFSKYKRPTALRRLARRMQVHHQETLGDYLAFLRHNAEEAQALFDELLISVTTFFRDPEVWEVLAERVIVPLLEHQEPDAPLRVWVPGCATGEEAYTLAMLLLEAADRRGVWPDIQIFASDLDPGTLATGREGRYPSAIEADVSEARLRRFFTREDDHYRVTEAVRERVVFAHHSLLRDPPFSRLHLISCRSLLIYLDRELQEQVFEVFRYALRPGGFLFLGASESAEGEHFRTLDKKQHLFQARDITGQPPRLPELVLATPQLRHSPKHPRPHLAPASVPKVHRQLLEALAPPSLLVNEQRQVLHLSETAGRFLQPPGGPLVHDVTALVRPALQLELNTALHHAFDQHKAYLSGFVSVHFNGTPRRVAILVQPRSSTEQQEHLALVVFLEGDEEVTPTADVAEEEPAAGVRERRLKGELQQTQTRLRTSREEFEVSNEELRAANEELQSLNEEYRSTGEELETSKEELQSINEELQTVNTELKNKLEEVSRANNDLENLMAATEIGTLFLDRRLRIYRFTSPVAALFHIKTSDRGRSITDFNYGLDDNRLEADARQVLRNLVPLEREARGSDGTWYLVRLRPYRTANDNIDGVVITFVDVTALKQAEMALRQSEARFRALIEASAQIVWTADTEGKIVEDSPSWRAFTGQRFAELKGDGGMNMVHPDERAHVADNWRRAVDTETPMITEFRLYHAPSGDWRWTQVRAVPLHDEVGSLRGWIGMNSDINQQKEAEKALAQQAEQLREQDRRKDEFLALLGHELRNPLAAMYSTVEVLRRNGESVSIHQQGVRLIDQQVQHLLRLVEDLLNITRISRGHIELQMKPLNLTDNLTSALDQVRPQIEARHHRLELNLPEQPLYVEADPERLTQVVVNLLSNAAHYTEEGGEITLTVEQNNDAVLIRVRDNGIGIAPEDMTHLFQAFSRLESATKHYQFGLGLGLALANQLVELHGGRLEVSSAGPGQGSEFTVYLPILPEEPSSEPPQPPTKPATEPRSRRILLVEDEQDIRESLAMLLQVLDHEVWTVSRGGQALEAVRKFNPELVFLDIGLPDMSGYEVAQQLLQAFDYKALRLIALTGYGQEEDLQRAAAAGFSRHLLKPAKIEALQAVLREF